VADARQALLDKIAELTEGTDHPGALLDLAHAYNYVMSANVRPSSA
jgi:hypothetical protein